MIIDASILKTSTVFTASVLENYDDEIDLSATTYMVVEHTTKLVDETLVCQLHTGIVHDIGTLHSIKVIESNKVDNALKNHFNEHLKVMQTPPTTCPENPEKNLGEWLQYIQTGNYVDIGNNIDMLRVSGIIGFKGDTIAYMVLPDSMLLSLKSGNIIRWPNHYYSEGEWHHHDELPTISHVCRAWPAVMNFTEPKKSE